jgi:hypothetical protein
VRSWLVIPAMGFAAPAVALALGAAPLDALAAAGAGAALAAAVRALAGETPAATAAAAIAPLVAVASIAARGGGLAAPYLALAGIGWTAAELARPAARALVTLVPATLAAILSPAAAALIAIAGARPTAGPRPRWALAVPLAGAIAVVVALIAGLRAHSGFAALWFGAPARPISPLALAGRVADALGPIAAIAAIGGLGALARPRPRPGREHLPELAIGACLAGALLVDLRAGETSALTLGLGALAAALGAARFAGQIRLPSGQALAGAAVGLMLLLPPAWTAIEARRGRAAAPPSAAAPVPAAGGLRSASASR